MKILKRDLIIVANNSKLTITLVTTAILLVGLAHLFNINSSKEFLSLLRPKIDENYIYSNLYYLMLVISGIFISRCFSINDLFRNNWMVMIRVENRSRIFIFKLIFILLFNIVYYQILALIMNLGLILVLGDRLAFKEVQFYLFLISLGVYSLNALDIFLEILLKNVIALLICISIILFNLYTQNICFIGSITSILLDGNYRESAYIFYLVYTLIVIFIGATLFVNKDLI